MNVVITLIEWIGLNWLSNLMMLPQLIKICMKNAWFTLQIRFPWSVVWYVHSCWSSARIDTCRCRCEGAWALSLLRRIKWCSTKDALELQCEWNPRIASLTWCALLCGYSIAPRIKQGVSEEGVPWSSYVAGKSGILFIIGVLTRSSYSPFRASGTRAVNVQASFLSSVFLSHSLTHALTRTAHTPQWALHA